MNYRYFLVGFTGLVLSLAASCKRDRAIEEVSSVSSQDATASLERLYHQAIGLKDYSSASMILLDLIDRQSSQGPRWKEEQVKAYFAAQNFQACATVAKDLIEHHNGGSNTGLVEMLGVSQEAIGQKTEALATWTGLLEKTANPSHAVRLAGLLISTNEHAKAKDVVEKALESPDLDKLSVQLPVSPGRLQNVSVKAALNNLKGLICLKEDPKKNLEVARAAFSAALEQSPEFAIAKRNLTALNQAAGPAKPVAQPAIPVAPSAPGEAPAAQ